MLSATAHAVQGWMWFNSFPWVYSHEDENWIFIASEIEISLHENGQLTQQTDSEISSLGWLWMNHFPWCYSHNEKKWIHITTPSSSKKDVIIIELKDGEVVIETFRDDAPKHVERIEKLASTGQYNGVVFHRVIEGFMAQTGDVKHGRIDNFQDSLVGTGGSDLPNLNSEFNDIKHVRGTCSMARANDPHSANSQFFICFEPAPFLDNQYTVWGQVIKGMEYVDQIKVGDASDNGKVIDPDHMLKVSVEKYAPIHAYGVWNNEWSEFQSYIHDWDKQYSKWILNPEPYGGTEALTSIKEERTNKWAYLNLNDYDIRDLSPIKSLQHLRQLIAERNSISDLSPISKLIKLEHLAFDENNISDLTFLGDLTNLTSLRLRFNKISDLSPLVNLKKLTTLNLTGNIITSLDPLSQLSNLNQLYLGNNDINDFTPLLGLTNLIRLDLGGTMTKSQKVMLEAALPNTTINWPYPIYDDELFTEDYWRAWSLNPKQYGGLQVLQKIKDAKDEGSTSLNLSYSEISDLTPLADLTSLSYLDLSNNKNNILDFSPITNLVNLNQLRLWDSNITVSQKAMLENALPNTYIAWPNLNLIYDTEWEERYAIALQNPKPYGGVETLQSIKELKYKYVGGDGPFLNLYNKEISDVSLLDGLPDLTNIWLGRNDIENLSPLSGLTKLKYLTITDISLSNQATLDITPLLNLKNLVLLDIGENPLSASQISLLKEALPNTTIQGIPDPFDQDLLSDEYFSEWVKNPKTYGGLYRLQKIKKAKDDEATSLNLSGARISDLTPLSSLNNLTSLNLSSNAIVDLSPLTELKNLKWLDLKSNKLVELSPLIELKKLTNLNLAGNIIKLSQQNMLTEAIWGNFDETGNFLNVEWPELIYQDDLFTDEYWIQFTSDPLPYGGLQTLQEIKYAIENNSTSLNFYKRNISDLMPLEGLLQLKELTLQGNNIEDLGPLSKLANLEWLILNDNYTITDVEPLSSLTKLKTLNLNTNDIDDVSPLAELVNLESLDLKYNKRLKDISSLENLVNLKNFQIDLQDINDLSVIKNFEQLEYVSLINQDISDLSILQNMHSIIGLDLRGNRISELNIISNMSTLKYLSLQDNEISDITPLLGMTHLEYLYLWKNNITDLDKEKLGQSLPSTQIEWDRYY